MNWGEEFLVLIIAVRADIGDLMEFVENSLCSGFVADGGANVVCFQERGEAGKVT